jgi:hypothetical protein
VPNRVAQKGGAREAHQDPSLQLRSSPAGLGGSLRARRFLSCEVVLHVRRGHRGRGIHRCARRAASRGGWCALRRRRGRSARAPPPPGEVARADARDRGRRERGRGAVGVPRVASDRLDACSSRGWPHPSVGRVDAPARLPQPGRGQRPRSPMADGVRTARRADPRGRAQARGHRVRGRRARPAPARRRARRRSEARCDRARRQAPALRAGSARGGRLDRRRPGGPREPRGGRGARCRSPDPRRPEHGHPVEVRGAGELCDRVRAHPP